MPISSYKNFIEGSWIEAKEKKQLKSPFSGDEVAEVHQASPDSLEKASQAAFGAAPEFRRISRHLKSKLLLMMAAEIENHRTQFIKKMIDEAGKPYSFADIEVSRAIQTFTTAAEEAKRFGGEVIPLDSDASGRFYAPAISYWFARGPILAITPFNFPLNLVAHKVAPALAVGCPILVKPSPQAPGCAYLLAEIFEKVVQAVSDSREKISSNCFQVLSCSNEVISKAVTDERFTTLSFTGSNRVGWHLQTQAVRKKLALELGGNAAVIIHSDADLKRAAMRCASGGFGYAGQSCISVQRILVQKKVADEFTQNLLKETALLKIGDPNLKDTSIGPVIDELAADRIMNWLEEAKREGAKILLGGTRLKNIIQPTILVNVKSSSKISCEEVFAPIVMIEQYDKIDEALKSVNASKFGLQAGVFSNDSQLIFQALQTLEVGGVVANDIPTYRADHMPYGGVKESGLGREGVKYAMEEYSERRTLISWIG